jgi:hypothetical protein
MTILSLPTTPYKSSLPRLTNKNPHKSLIDWFIVQDANFEKIVM